VEGNTSELREAPETRMKMNESTGDPKSTQNISHGPYLTESREVQCETSVLPPGISSPTIRSMSSLPNHISSTQGLPKKPSKIYNILWYCPATIIGGFHPVIE